jgi:hypothetical protein
MLLAAFMTDPLEPAAGPADPEAEIRLAMDDLETRTFAELPGDFAKLIYLASLRDHNTGRYSHYGLETRYSPAAVDEALRRCHVQVFEGLMARSLEEQVRDLVGFFTSLKEDRGRLVEAWQRLRSYQILPPENCHPLARELFDSNIPLILRVLRETELWDLLGDSAGNPNHLP